MRDALVMAGWLAGFLFAILAKLNEKHGGWWNVMRSRNRKATEPEDPELLVAVSPADARVGIALVSWAFLIFLGATVAGLAMGVDEPLPMWLDTVRLLCMATWTGSLAWLTHLDRRMLEGVGQDA